MNPLYAQYKENEDHNEHTENLLLLAQTFGTEQEIAEISLMIIKRNRMGYVNFLDHARGRDIHDKYYKKLYALKDVTTYGEQQ
jgi:hypothetical protein